MDTLLHYIKPLQSLGWVFSLKVQRHFEKQRNLDK